MMSKTVSLRLSDEMFAYLVSRTEATGISRNAYLAHLLLNDQVQSKAGDWLETAKVLQQASESGA